MKNFENCSSSLHRRFRFVPLSVSDHIFQVLIFHSESRFTRPFGISIISTWKWRRINIINIIWEKKQKHDNSFGVGIALMVARLSCVSAMLWCKFFLQVSFVSADNEWVSVTLKHYFFVQFNANIVNYLFFLAQDKTYVNKTKSDFIRLYSFRWEFCMIQCELRPFWFPN